MPLPAIILMIAALSAAPIERFNPSHGDGAPPVALVQKRAIEHARLDPSEISTWKRRARLKALLPRLQVDYSRRARTNVDVDVNDSVYVGSGGVAVGPDAGGYKEASDLDNNVGFKAVWDFSEAVFNPDLLAVSEEARLLARERLSILAEVNRNYYERERASAEMALLGAERSRRPRDDKIAEKLLTKRIAFDEATAALDALTGGWFSGQAGGGR